MFEALSWTVWLTALSVGVQTIELLALRRSFSEQGVWRWSVLRREFQNAPPIVGLCADAVFSYRPFLILLTLRLAAALMLFAAPSWPLFLLLLVSQVVICIRWRGTFNGGSDYMTIILLSGLLFAFLFAEREIYIFAALCYIALHSLASYTIAGYAKIRSPAWRSGKALAPFLCDALYEPPVFLQSVLQKRSQARALSWGILLYECFFPIVFLHPLVCTAFLVLGFLFHLLNAHLFGLNRFLLTWCATYPALHFCASVFRFW